LADEVRRIKEKERDMVREIQDNLNKEIAGLYRSIRDAENELKKQRSRERVERAKREMERITREADQRSKELGEKLAVIGEQEERPEQIKVGDLVRLHDMDTVANVLRVDEQQGLLEAQVGDIKLTLRMENVDKLETPGPGADVERTVARPRTIRPASPELDLRGHRADMVESELDSYLNEAFMSHLEEVRIIHGYGTGAVRNSVRGYLANHQLVKSFRPGGQGEGGDGVTLVKLA